MCSITGYAHRSIRSDAKEETLSARRDQREIGLWRGTWRINLVTVCVFVKLRIH
ncbi:hypothetical protein QJS10_CPA08g01115 [Acorus calamus]|uniref:Uncharacterized protein n=1 Tax=Acorus calamus TaxID=4465 RepID=A0AAV9ECR8_ACOCL|nr:hypothetical protein QJS10_CPA08g01115 [Acorus calamus]